MATRKQAVYLEYMGFKDVHLMSVKEAAEAINSIFDGFDWETHIWRDKRVRSWKHERHLLYPDLYLDEFLYGDFSERLHQFVRARVTGAKDHLNKARIKTVIKSLLADDPEWWKRDGNEERFFERLGVMYPGCVDGTVKRKRKRITAALEAEPVESDFQQRIDQRQKTAEVWTTIDVERVGPSVETLEAIRRDSGRYEPDSKYWRLLLFAAAGVLVLLAVLVAFSLSK